jgi:hypothetical protein
MNSLEQPIVKQHIGEPHVMSNTQKDKLRIHVNIEIPAAALQAIVSHAKRSSPKDGQGAYRIDTADRVSEVITRFLEEKDFESYTRDLLK